MREVWLRPNRRALLWSMPAPLALAAVGAALAAAAWYSWGSMLLAAVGLIAVLFGLLGAAGLLWMAMSPRLAYEADELLVNLGRSEPYRVPIEIVEVFFLGQGPSMLPRQWGQAKGASSETSNVIVRLADTAESWHRRPANPWFGQWCDGYITIRGTWCEPLTREVFERLNGRLVEVHRQRRAASPGTSAVERRQG